MIKLIDKQRIIIMHTNERKSQREISRELNIDRKTISIPVMSENAL